MRTRQRGLKLDRRTQAMGAVAVAGVLGEPAGRRRLAGAAVVVAGITTLALA